MAKNEPQLTDTATALRTLEAFRDDVFMLRNIINGCKDFMDVDDPEKLKKVLGMIIKQNEAVNRHFNF